MDFVSQYIQNHGSFKSQLRQYFHRLIQVEAERICHISETKTTVS